MLEKCYWDTEGTVNVENLGTAGYLSGFSLKKVCKAGPHFNKGPEANLCAVVKLCNLRFIFCTHPLVVQRTPEHTWRRWGNHIFHNKLEMTSLLCSTSLLASGSFSAVCTV